MPKTEIFIQSSSRDIIDAATELNIADVYVEHLMLKCEIDSAMLFTAVASFASGVGVNLFSQWLYDKIKSNPNEKTVINGHHISANIVQVNQIVQVIERQQNSSEDDSKPR